MCPHNLLIKFNSLLDIVGMSQNQAEESLMRIFQRDMIDNPCPNFNNKTLIYINDNSVHSIKVAFDHLIKNKQEGKRNNIDNKRAARLHWIKHFLENGIKENMGFWVFSHKMVNSNIRTYIFHKKSQFLIILEPNEKKGEYYLVTAHFREGSGLTDTKSQYQSRLSEIY